MPSDNKEELILVFSDAHVTPEDKFPERFNLLAELIQDLTPDVIVQLGDFCTFDSLSSHVKSKKLELEGMRFVDELQAVHRAYHTIERGVQEATAATRRSKKKVYDPVKVWMYGNHENRLASYLQENTQMLGMAQSSKYWIEPSWDRWQEVPYKQVLARNGILFMHCAMNGINKPMSSKYLAKNILADYSGNVVYGHTHKLTLESIGRETLEGGKRFFSLNAGCFFDLTEDMPGYAKGSSASRDWWSGVVLIRHDTETGDYDIQTIGMNRLKETYPWLLSE